MTFWYFYVWCQVLFQQTSGWFPTHADRLTIHFYHPDRTTTRLQGDIIILAPASNDPIQQVPTSDHRTPSDLAAPSSLLTRFAFSEALSRSSQLSVLERTSQIAHPSAWNCLDMPVVDPIEQRHLPCLLSFFLNFNHVHDTRSTVFRATCGPHRTLRGRSCVPRKAWQGTL